MTNGSTVELMKFDIRTPKKMNINYLGFVSGLSRYLAIMATTYIKIMFEIDETNEAPACIKFE
jgi:hypothetical protein